MGFCRFAPSQQNPEQVALPAGKLAMPGIVLSPPTPPSADLLGTFASAKLMERPHGNPARQDSSKGEASEISRPSRRKSRAGLSAGFLRHLPPLLHPTPSARPRFSPMRKSATPFPLSTLRAFASDRTGPREKNSKKKSLRKPISFARAVRAHR